MADHLRKQIRGAVVAALDGLAATASRVYASRVYPMEDTNLPGLRVYTPSEEVDLLSMGAGRRRERHLSLVVEACLKATTGYDDTADEIQRQVEVALDADNGLGGLCHWVELKSVEDAFEGEAEKPVAVKRMTFDVLYYTALGAPDVPL